MPRRSLRSSSAVTTPQKPATKTPHSSKRSRPTPTKSKYTEQPSSDDDDADVDNDSSDAAEAEASGYEDEDASLSEPSSLSEIEDEEYDTEESSRPKKRQNRGRVTQSKASTKTAAMKTTKGQELWRQGVKTGLGPGTQIIIDRPKARPAGTVKYTDDTVHPNTMLFLSELAENNDREWLKMHDPDYRASLKDFNSFVECLQEELVKLDETIPELPIKDVVFRIYRDVRFSPDQTPYKTYFSAAWSRTGRKGPFAAYYVQIKPKGSFVGGGLWMPDSQPLAKLRREVDRKPQNLKRVLQDSKLRKQFFAGVGDNEKKVVTAFVEQNTENALKTKPKGYDADHKDIALLRLKNYTIGRKLDDEEVIGSQGITRVAELVSCLVPFITYLNSIIMPDEPDEDHESDDSGNDDDRSDQSVEDE